MKPACFRVSLTIALLAAGTFSSARAVMLPMQATAETDHHRLELDIAGREQMYSKTDAERLKPTSGEIMVSGQMVGGTGGMQAMPGMSSNNLMQTGTAMRHLELHVRSKATGQAIHDVDVGMTVADPAGRQRMVVPIAVMYGIAEGLDDWHYGNNVHLLPGHYVVLVTANHESARFDVSIVDK